LCPFFSAFLASHSSTELHSSEWIVLPSRLVIFKLEFVSLAKSLQTKCMYETACVNKLNTEGTPVVLRSFCRCTSIW
jgi:hypothetical protein